MMENPLRDEDAVSPLSREALTAVFREAEKPADRWRVGTEAEKFGVLRASGAPIGFDGPSGVRAVLEGLAHRFGWREKREHPDGPLIALRRDAASITLEPGAQLELSGAPFATVHQTAREFADHIDEVHAVSEPLGIAWLGLGFHPTAAQADLPWVPKLRYGVMKRYLPTRGGMAHDMMRRTATVQANLDYADEADAARKLRVGLGLSPIITAMFANSPFVEGAPSGERTHRGRVWLDTDPDRAGLLPFAWADDFGYDDYVAWALGVPMFGFMRDGALIANPGQPFSDFLANGYRGHRATRADWEMHLNTLFPEVRLKATLEVRGADVQPTDRLCALPALCKGVFYDARALERAEALIDWDHDALAAARLGIARDGLAAMNRGTPRRRARRSAARDRGSGPRTDRRTRRAGRRRAGVPASDARAPRARTGPCGSTPRADRSRRAAPAPTPRAQPRLRAAVGGVDHGYVVHTQAPSGKYIHRDIIDETQSVVMNTQGSAWSYSAEITCQFNRHLFNDVHDDAPSGRAPRSWTRVSSSPVRVRTRKQTRAARPLPSDQRPMTSAIAMRAPPSSKNADGA